MIEIGALGVNKAIALAKVCSRYQIDSADVIAFGDGENDIEMLQYAGHGVAMANAMPRAKLATKYHTASVDEGGVGIYLDKLFHSENLSL
jgi:hydroxymethylpyrimidine pyrophosphatase-like HAD family hydrolase